MMLAKLGVASICKWPSSDDVSWLGRMPLVHRKGHGHHRRIHLGNQRIAQFVHVAFVLFQIGCIFPL